MDGREMIFVFGSNMAGVHGAGAALYALKHWGAAPGVGEGLEGASYALPTKDGAIITRSLNDVSGSVNLFLNVATAHPELSFQVTRVGCGLAGFQDSEIAPLFIDAPANCYFDEAWKQYLPAARFWGTYGE